MIWRESAEKDEQANKSIDCNHNYWQLINRQKSERKG